MEKQQFLNKFEELKSPANAERWAVLQLWLVEAKSDGEIGTALGKDRSTATRKIGEICKHFGTDAKGKKEQRQHLVLLFRRHCKDFEVHPSVYPEWVDGDMSDRPQPPANPQNIPTPESIPELTTLEFIGRDRDLTNLANLSRQAKIVLIKAGAGVGKSTLAREFLQTQFKKVIRIEMGLESGNVTPAEEKVSQILRKDFDDEPSRDFGINLDILREKLGDRVNPIGVLIDNLEPALDENYRFREKLRGYDALLAVLGDRDVFSFTLITSRRSLIATRAKVNEYSLEGLDITAWRQYFHDCENGADSEALMQMCVAYNGNAKVMDILHGAIKNRFDGNIGAYWSRYKDALLADSELETLISVEMDWLRDNQPDAYKLLCRMGCYRYQDVKTVPFEGLICLLWDVPESRQIWVVNYLSKSSLIESKGGEYYLHPSVREAAKSCLLKDKIDWNKSNREAAIFWSNSVFTVESVDLALRAIESVKHFLAINDFKSAAAEMIKRRKNKFYSYKDGEYLFGSVERLGLSLNLVSFIHKIVDNITPSEALIKIYQFLGTHYCLMGAFKKGISYYQESKNIADKMEYLNYQISSLLMIGIANLNVFDIDNALNSFSLALGLTHFVKEERLKYLTGYACFCLALAESFQEGNNVTNIEDLLSQSDKIMSLCSLTTRGAAFYPLYSAMTYQNIGRFEIASDKYKEAINFAKKSGFKQVEGIVTNLQASILRINQEIESAIVLHFKAEKLLLEIGSRCDLAEVYFQLGLTYQVMGEHNQAEEYKAKALELFAQMEAPKQIERVNKAFGGNIQ